MQKREYYSIRTGLAKPSPELKFKILRKHFLVVYKKIDTEGYFQKYFGFHCTDGDKIGELGPDIESVVFFNLEKENLWPLEEKLESYSIHDLFSIIEFLHDHCSKPHSNYYHNWIDCGYHYGDFNDLEGQADFRNQMNKVLRDFEEGYELSESGEVLVLAKKGMDTLLKAKVPAHDPDNVEARVERAVQKFRRSKSTWDERRDAVRELVDVLEYLRPVAKRYLLKPDEADLFNLANNFGIRHHNQNQKTDYDKPIWYTWLFYHYLATIHALLRMIEKGNDSGHPDGA